MQLGKNSHVIEENNSDKDKLHLIILTFQSLRKLQTSEFYHAYRHHNKQHKRSNQKNENICFQFFTRFLKVPVKL